LRQHHPRPWGSIPRVLGHDGRDLGLPPLETAVWKMRGLTARKVQLPRRWHGVCTEQGSLI